MLFFEPADVKGASLFHSSQKQYLSKILLFGMQRIKSSSKRGGSPLSSALLKIYAFLLRKKTSLQAG